MEFLLNTKEIWYIMNIYSIKELKGFNNRFHYNPADKDATVKSLTEKHYLIAETEDEIIPELVQMFKSWSRTVYSMSRPEQNDIKHSIYLLSDKDFLLAIERTELNYQFKYTPSSRTNMYLAGEFFGRIYDVEADQQYQLRMTVDEFAEFADKAVKQNSEYLTNLSNSCGIKQEELIKLAMATILTSPDDTTKILTEDYERKIGIMTKVINTTSGIYLFKHKTYKDHETILLAKGSKAFAISSIYNF